MEMHNYAICVMSFSVYVECLSYHSSACLFCSSYLFRLSVNLRFLSWNGVQFLCNFLFLLGILLWILCPIIGPFIFRNLGYCYPLKGPGKILCVRWSYKNAACWLFIYLVRWLPYLWITFTQSI